MKSLSIGLRLTLSYFLIFLLAEVIFGTGMFLILRQNLFNIADNILDDQAADLQRFLEARTNTPRAELQKEIAEDYQIERSEDYLQISDDAGNPLYRSNFLEENPLPPVSLDDLDRPQYRNRKLGRQRFRILSRQVEVDGHVYVVRIGRPMEEESETLTAFRRYLLWFAPFLLLGASVVGYWLSRRALAPVDTLAQTARTISGHNLSSRLEQLHTGDELQRLSDTLNEMLERIEFAFRRITEFTADASHELRTPIAVIHTEAELALRRSRDEAAYREALQHILLESDRTARLIEQLLALARADSGSEGLDLKAIDLLPTLRESATKWSQIAAQRGLHFETRFDSHTLPMLGDENALRRVIDILLDNACKYTPSPGSVTLFAREQGECMIIGVTDTGIGIGSEDHSKIYERFYRVDKARSRESGGAGLGLSIAQWIVQLHQGTIDLKSEVGKGSIFQVELPAQPVLSTTSHDQR